MTDEQTVRDALAALPALCQSLSRGEVDGPERSARRSRRARTDGGEPVNLALVDALDTRRKRHNADPTWCDENRQGILPTLDAWAVLLEADMLDRSPQLPADLPEPPTVDDVCAWLDAHLHWWLGKPEWDEFSADVESQWRRARTLAGVRPDDVQRCLGTGGCGGVVEHVGAEVYRCRGCGKERSLRSVMDVSLPQAAAMVGVPERTLRSWAARFLIHPLDGGLTERLRRYDLNEIRRVRDEVRGRTA